MFSPQVLKNIIEAGSHQYRENSVSFILYCPYCSKEKLYIRKRDGHFKCWVCAETQNFGGRAEFALTRLYGGPLKEYRDLLYGDGAGTMVPYLQVTLADYWGEDEDAIEAPAPLVDWEWSPMSAATSEAAFEPGRRYLAGRGLSDALMAHYGVHYEPWENRVQFPFVVDGKLVGWQGRLCGPDKFIDPVTGYRRRIPKALTTIQEGVQGRYFMFGDCLRGSEHAVLCEGPMDAIKAHLCGGNVASLGKAVTPFQIEWLSNHVSKLYVGLDTDAADDMARIIKNKGMDLQIYILEPPKGRQDLGASTCEEVYENFRTARRFYRGQIIVNVGGRLCY